MREHRLIERVLKVCQSQLEIIQDGRGVDTDLMIVLIDFLRTYADRIHHGKEEYILFTTLASKPLAEDHQRILGELVQEHYSARRTVTLLADSTQDYKEGNTAKLDEIVECLRELTRLSPSHIEKEDSHFFYPALEYLTKQEQGAMLQEFWEFDRKLIHDKYESIVGEIEKQNLA